MYIHSLTQNQRTVKMELLYKDQIVYVGEIHQNLEETPVIIKGQFGQDKGTLSWHDYKPKVTTLYLGELQELKCHVDHIALYHKISSDQLLQQGVDLDSLDTNIEAQFEDFTQITKEYVAMGYNYTLIKGHVQSGKTMFIVAQAISNYLQGVTTLVVVRPMYADLLQLETRFKSRFQELKAKMLYLNKDFFRDDIICNVKKATKLLKKSKEPRIVIALANYAQLGLFENLVEEEKLHKKFVAMLDEADFIDTEKDDKKSKVIETLKEFSLRVYGITATTNDILVQEDLKATNVKILRPLPVYKSIESITWKMLDEPMQLLKNPKTVYQYDSSVKKVKPIFKSDHNLRPFLKKFSKWKPVYQEWAEDYHPIMYLLKIGYHVEYMEILQDWLKKVYSNVTTIVYNGKGIRIWSGNKDTITIKGKQISLENDYYNIKGVSISSVIGYLKNIAGGYKTHPRILIISGHMASRGISFVSDDYGECIANNTLGWHIIGEYFNCSDTMPQSELIQAARLCGNHPDTIPLRWYTSPKLCRDIKRSFELVTQLLDTTVKESEEYDIILRDALPKVCIQKDTMIKRKMAKHHNIEKKITVTKSYTIKTNDPIFVIIPSTLSTISKKYYQYFIDIIDEHFGTGIWRTKAEIVNLASKKYNVSTLKLANTSHPWHDINKNNGAVSHCYSTKDETVSGLLFKQDTDSSLWFIRYNV